MICCRTTLLLSNVEAKLPTQYSKLECYEIDPGQFGADLSVSCFTFRSPVFSRSAAIQSSACTATVAQAQASLPFAFSAIVAADPIIHCLTASPFLKPLSIPLFCRADKMKHAPPMAFSFFFAEVPRIIAGL